MVSVLIQKSASATKAGLARNVTTQYAPVKWMIPGALVAALALPLAPVSAVQDTLVRCVSIQPVPA